jgi:hypothetical protein
LHIGRETKIDIEKHAYAVPRTSVMANPRASRVPTTRGVSRPRLAAAETGRAAVVVRVGAAAPVAGRADQARVAVAAEALAPARVARS